jgi:hypothetical protein
MGASRARFHLSSPIHYRINSELPTVHFTTVNGELQISDRCKGYSFCNHSGITEWSTEDPTGEFTAEPW